MYHVHFLSCSMVNYFPSKLTFCFSLGLVSQMKEILAHQAKLSSLRSRGSDVDESVESSSSIENDLSANAKSQSDAGSPTKAAAEKAPTTPAASKIRKLETLVASASAPKRSKVRFIISKRVIEDDSIHSLSFAGTYIGTWVLTVSSTLSFFSFQTSPQMKMAKANFLGIGAKKALEAKYARKAASVGLDRSKKTKMAHTGSGLPLNGVVRLKYVKGFTQAVRTPCPLQDLE